MVKRFIYKKINDGISSRRAVILKPKSIKKEEIKIETLKEKVKKVALEEKIVDVIENNEEIKENIVMDTKEKIQMAAAVLNAEQPKVKKVKKDKGLIERTESSITILTEDNRELLKD